MVPTQEHSIALGSHLPCGLQHALSAPLVKAFTHQVSDDQVVRVDEADAFANPRPAGGWRPGRERCQTGD